MKWKSQSFSSRKTRQLFLSATISTHHLSCSGTRGTADSPSCHQAGSRYTLDMFPVHHTATERQRRQTAIRTYTLMVNLTVPIKLTCFRTVEVAGGAANTLSAGTWNIKHEAGVPYRGKKEKLSISIPLQFLFLIKIIFNVRPSKNVLLAFHHIKPYNKPHNSKPSVTTPTQLIPIQHLHL